MLMATSAAQRQRIVTHVWNPWCKSINGAKAVVDKLIEDAEETEEYGPCGIVKKKPLTDHNFGQGQMIRDEKQQLNMLHQGV
jgi:hypothetical protein